MATVSEETRRAPWLALAALLMAASGCHDETVAPPAVVDAGSDARPAGEAGAATDTAASPAGTQPEVIDCFMGTPKTNDELLNQCWPEDVVTFVKKPALPGGYTVGMPLPPPP
jgi:hypothetical protein